MPIRTTIRQESKWHYHFFYRKESIKTTWMFRFTLLLLIVLLVFVTRGFWTVQIGKSLVCAEEVSPSDIILIENFDPSYLVFERAASLRQAGLATRVLIPTEVSPDSERAGRVAQGIAELMARIAHLPAPEILPIWVGEPISLNTAYQIRNFLIQEHLKSMIVVTDGFRSKRSLIIYHAVLDAAGIEVSCMPVFEKNTPQNWLMTWHGIQNVIEQFLKLKYYQIYILRVRMT